MSRPIGRTSTRVDDSALRDVYWCGTGIMWSPVGRHVVHVNEDVSLQNSNSRRARRSAAETRSIVLDAAVDWIEENGSSSLKVSEIARAAGVSEVLMYRYFMDRQGLLTAALVELWERYMAHPIAAIRQIIDDLPAEALTPELLANLALNPSSETAKKSRWARLQVLAASPENPELSAMIKQSQSRINAEHESLIDLIRYKMPGVHLPSVRIMRMLNQNVIFGFVIEDLVDDPITDEELRDFLIKFYDLAFEPEVK